MRYAARKDENQDEITDALRKSGLRVQIIREPCDLAVCADNRLHVYVEVKNPQQKRRTQRLTEREMAFYTGWPGDYIVVRTTDEALALSQKMRLPLNMGAKVTDRDGNTIFIATVDLAEYCDREMRAYFDDIYGGIPEEAKWRAQRT